MAAPLVPGGRYRHPPEVAVSGRPRLTSGIATSRLETYQAMRDFSRTPEPSGAGPALTPGGPGTFVVQRHRARRLHYDLRLEMDGVLVSWAVPKGPTLDPAARHLAVHVEDHPIEYADFEGVIGRGEYGGGDVIVWDRGTWSLARGDDAVAAVAAGELHFDLNGQKLRGRFVLIRREKDRSGKEQWLLLHKKDEHAVAGWDPEEHGESVKTGRTNDEVAADPDARWNGDAPAAEAELSLRPRRAPARFTKPARREMNTLGALGVKGTWAVDGRELALTNLDKVLFPGRDGEEPITKRELIGYHAQIAPVMLPALVDRPVNLNRYPNGVDKAGFWHKAVPSHAPPWLTRWHYDDARPGETEWYFVVDSVAALAWMANYGALELHPWTSTIDDGHEPTWAYIDIDPGTESTFDDVLVLARLFRTALDHLGVVGGPKVTGQRGIQIWVPVRRGYRFDDTRAWVEAVSRAVGATVPELVSWKWHKNARSGKARLDYTQNAINKTLVAPYSARPRAGAPVSVPITWDELDDPDLAPDRWTIRNVLERVRRVGDPFAALYGTEQALPKI